MVKPWYSCPGFTVYCWATMCCCSCRKCGDRRWWSKAH